jgi:formamidopyrimidine-DNA glycosylase
MDRPGWSGTLLLTEAGSKRRASIHLVDGHSQLAEHEPGGLDLAAVAPGRFEEALPVRATRCNEP